METRTVRIGPIQRGVEHEVITVLRSNHKNHYHNGQIRDRNDDHNPPVEYRIESNGNLGGNRKNSNHNPHQPNNRELSVEHKSKCNDSYNSRGKDNHLLQENYDRLLQLKKEENDVKKDDNASPTRGGESPSIFHARNRYDQHRHQHRQRNTTEHKAVDQRQAQQQQAQQQQQINLSGGQSTEKRIALLRNAGLEISKRSPSPLLSPSPSSNKKKKRSVKLANVSREDNLSPPPPPPPPPRRSPLLDPIPRPTTHHKRLPSNRPAAHNHCNNNKASLAAAPDPIIAARPAYGGLRVSFDEYPDPEAFRWAFVGSCEERRIESFEKDLGGGRGTVALDFHYTTGTVKTTLNHPVWGTSLLVFARGGSRVSCGLSPKIYRNTLIDPIGSSTNRDSNRSRSRTSSKRRTAVSNQPIGSKRTPKISRKTASASAIP
eukprot:CAMPEP_0201131364 /NCGR_PEP_ID=MMETSP0850-20130426/42584_1 /ASSEMBLY_ACC=CAM_ASM_000622 /TAXON_ID=183588 /ORGANISM="Pseudo-nitzschia fraudulenta, Strain WWA7" /LENGTH=431 /DNA_ID=CAMNT_0047401391 /DNA_START=640 /DNA_END=1935 /DNA_ORIENTATION=-